jgi:hypothetical protein
MGQLGKILRTLPRRPTVLAATTSSMTGTKTCVTVALSPAYVLTLSATLVRHLLSLQAESPMAKRLKILRVLSWHFIQLTVDAVATPVAHDEKSASVSISRVIVLATTGRMSAVAVVQFYKNFTSFVSKKSRHGQCRNHHWNRRWKTTDDFGAIVEEKAIPQWRFSNHQHFEM